MENDTIRRAAEAAVFGTRCTYSVARGIAASAAIQAIREGIDYDVDMLADVTTDILTAEGWI